MSSPQSWNRRPRLLPGAVRRLDNRFAQLPDVTTSLLPHGKGRSYGDVCLTDDGGTLLLTDRMSRFIAFDRANGMLRCEAGVTLGDILALIVPTGWFLPVTPGTRHVTVGGAIANDVHGKNHHTAGSFGHHVTQFELLRSDGEVIRCTPDHETDWFRATVGGLGLTGLIRWAELRLMPISNPFMWVESQRFGNLETFWHQNANAETRHPYTVAWIDCLARGASRGRGLLFAGQHAPPQPRLPAFAESRRRMPFDPPFSLVNRISLRAFNALYHRRPTHPEGQLSHYLPYFYPLDAIGHWNRIYGRSGFYQYQCVLPPETASDGIDELLARIATSGEGSFLAVLKSFGNVPPAGLLSFPRPGTTLALDFPARGRRTERLFQQLDAIVREAGGALYPAKDARMPGEMFRAGFPQWERFASFIDPQFSSGFWKRVTS